MEELLDIVEICQSHISSLKAISNVISNDHVSNEVTDSLQMKTIRSLLNTIRENNFKTFKDYYLQKALFKFKANKKAWPENKVIIGVTTGTFENSQVRVEFKTRRCLSRAFRTEQARDEGSVRLDQKRGRQRLATSCPTALSAARSATTVSLPEGLIRTKTLSVSS